MTPIALCRLRLPALVLAVGVAGGCVFDGAEFSPTLENVWPNADGTHWTHELVRRTWSHELTWYAHREDVPPLPSLDEIAAVLGRHPTGGDVRSETGEYRLRFDGTITTNSGVTAQHLVDEWVPPVAGRSADVSPLLQRIWIARPDLRERMLAVGVLRAPPAELRTAENPLFLSGYAWERTPDRIQGYGDLDAQPSWRYLDSDLSPGHEFTFQLLPSLSDDIFLHGRVLPWRRVETPAGAFLVVECLYVVDYGLTESRDELGNVRGYLGAFSYGTVAYAPDVGPVASYERELVQTGMPLTPGAGDFTISLKGWAQPTSR